MPPEEAEKQLTRTERDVLSRWVKQGGEYARHWAFVPPKKVKPKSIGPHLLGEIDAFVQMQHKNKGIAFAAEADRATLARRAALVLTGLPPKPKELAAFLDDKRSDAYERFVDQVLASPCFGEHQARYWLDAVRYGDTHGLHLDNRRGVYPYRDWVVHALNKNLPLDEFLTWQLAGDLLPNPSLEQHVATGFVRMNPSTAEGGAIPEEFQVKNNFDRVETAGTVLLGMTMTCARCHTHKYDPIPQTEYYRLLAFFNSTSEGPLDDNKYDYGPVIKAPGDQVAWSEWNTLNSECERLLAMAKAEPEGSAARTESQKKAAEVAARIALVEKGFSVTTLVARDLPKPRVTKLLYRGEYDLPIGDPLEPGIVTVMGAFSKDAPRNRLGLAQWLTSREHPLVARVLINRVWQRTFGEGLVRTPEDFGLQGQQPTHPQMLDWLAVELQDSGWNLKHMLRLMVTSKTFRQRSAWRKDVEDPENRLLARGPGHRLDAEVIRDIALWSSGLLKTEMGGEGVKPYQPPGLWTALAHPSSNTKEYVPDKDDRVYRRSLYVYWKRTSPHPMLMLFDAPSRESSCVRRSRSNTPLQSLGLFNERQRVETAVRFAERLLTEDKTEAARMDRLFLLLTCRPPNAAKRAACEVLLKQMKDRYGKAVADTRQLVGTEPTVAQLDPVEHAAWTQVVAAVLASDVAILLY